MRHSLDVQRLLCPMPVIKLQNMASRVDNLDEIEMQCTDPGTLEDIPTWCRMYHHEVLSQTQTDDVITFIVRIHHESSHHG
jgi:tRNA 2-thiouridine synthesizing protein A